MITRRTFLISLIVGLISGCTSREVINEVVNIDVDATNPESMVKSIDRNKIQKVTWGVIALQSYNFLIISLGSENIVKIDEEDLILHAHLVKKKVTKIFADSFEIVESLRYEEQLKKFADGKTAFVNWREIKNYLDNLIYSSDELLSGRVIRIMKELFAEDYKLIEGA
ncbi:MAG: hypothetical protein QNJ58_14325 [Desulfobacterales bacterium]|nr:hypothetical protein [Desulfobacterales bacterium]